MDFGGLDNNFACWCLQFWA